jgi:2-desacetyl-2-hydroxyethyl bacteriochlorophyllide A dehydrogenase
MGRVVELTTPLTVTVVDYDDQDPGPGEVRVQTLYSGISAGTELTQYRGSNPRLTRYWDSTTRLFLDGAAPASYPYTGWGYEEVGRIDAVGPDAGGVKPGLLVWGAWQHRSSVIMPAAWALEHPLPGQMPPQRAIFARIGAVALNAVLDADIHLGEYVAVFGLGVPGLLAMQMARRSGARMIAVDRVATRLALASELGAQHCIDSTERGAAEEIRALTGSRGADVSIEFTGSYHGLHDAVRATAYNSRVVACGFFQGDGIGLRLGEEFHHNRIAVVPSQISGIRPDLAHRWSHERLAATVMDLIAAGDVVVDPLISHVVPVERAADAFALLHAGDPDVLQVVLDFTQGST